MKKLSFLSLCCCLAGLYSQAQPIIPADSTISDQICSTSSYNWYRIVTPANGMLVLYTTASVDSPGPSSYQYLGIQVLGKNQNGAFPEVFDGQTSGTYFPAVGTSGVALSDTSFTCCLAEDTFYIRVDESLIAGGLCWNYTLHWHTIPATYADNPHPDSFPTYPVLLPYNTPETGNLGFDAVEGISVDPTNNWLIVPPTDGTLKINVSAEAQSGTYLTMQLYDNTFGSFVAAQYPPAGAFQAPVDSNFYINCIAAGDSFYLQTGLNVFGDGGYSYRISYTVIPPVYNADTTSNFSFATAKVVSAGLPIEDHSSFYYSGVNKNEYFKFYVPDTGSLTIQTWVETAEAIAPGLQGYLYIYDSTQSPLVSGFYPYIGGNSIAAGDTFTVHIPAAGWYYIKMPAANYCFSYKILLSGDGITAGLKPVAPLMRLNVYPNPSANNFTVDFGDIYNSTISVYNAMGQLVETQKQNNERFVVLGDKLTAGIYLIKAVNEDGEIITQGKVVKTN